ncbi:MAG: cell division protease FtsH [Fusobacteria bacterium]|nr:MAG: cell division protease FtsH [Fusobacteriota bacterium]KAF0228855.1 MAG: cell division protease [Fusobacteriota bacterium]
MRCKGDKDLKENIKRIIIGLMISGLIILTFMFYNGENKVETKSSFLEFSQMAERGEIDKAKVNVVDNSKVVVSWETNVDNSKSYVFEDNVNLINDAVTQVAKDNNIALQTSSISSVNVFGIINILLVGGVFVFVLFMIFNKNGGGSGAMQFGKSKAKLASEDVVNNTTFKDVAGIDEVKEELQEIIEFLKNPAKFTRFGAKIPKGVLLSGAPGTGKTLVAKAVAGEANVPFYAISGSEFVELYVGVGASRVRDLFDRAKKSSPCIVFIDEIDAVGRQRGAGVGGGHDEREQTLNQLLVEMDGFENNEAIIVMAATNRPDILDSALLRPGRFDRQIYISAPDVKGREEILLIHSKNKPLADDVDLKIIAKRTPGFNGADLANIINEAALLAVRKNEVKISMESVEQAIEREIAGPEKKSKVMNDKERKLIAFHETGHAVTSYFLENTDPVHKISIIPRGLAGGYTLTLPDEDKNYITKNDMLDSVCLLLGGRIAEELELGDISTGASNDLERASSIIRNMITVYGMTDELGALTYGHKSGEVFLGRDFVKEKNYSEEIAAKIDNTSKKYMDMCYEKTKSILMAHRDKLTKVAEKLMEQEVLSRDEFEALME